MIKKILSSAFLLSSLLLGFTSNKQEFNYSYEVYASSNSLGDLIKLYTYKEYLIDKYNELVNYLDPELHDEVIKENINEFAKTGSKATLENGKIVVRIGEAKGKKISGNLKKEPCDVEPVRVKLFFSDFFVR